MFLPGQREIARVQAGLQESLDAGVEVLALHGELPVEQQARVLQAASDGRRRVVATNVAESSVTLPGVRVVIDSGQAREPRYDPNSGFTRLDVVAIAQASADQRAGRAGRVAEGVAWRLWPQSQRLEPQRRAEIDQVELAGLALELAAWGSSDLRFLDPPPAGPMGAARELLQRLGALSDSGAITALGRRVLALGTHPRMAAMLLAAPDARAQALADLAPCWKRATRCARAVMPWPRAGVHWRRSAMAVHRATPTAAGWPRSMPPPGNGGDACAVMPRHRPASRPMSWATCSRTPSQTGLASSIPAIHCATSWPMAAARACTS